MNFAKLKLLTSITRYVKFNSTKKKKNSILLFIYLFQEVVVDLLQSMVEIVTYGDKQDPMIFEYENVHFSFNFSLYNFRFFYFFYLVICNGYSRRYFMECQVIAEFVRVLKISRNSRIEIPLLQYLSIMVQNLDTEHAICKL